MPRSGDASFGPRKRMSIDKLRISVEEVLGQQYNERERKTQGRGRFDFEADDVSVQQVNF